MCSHVPNNGEQVVRYYGHCSPALRGDQSIRAERENHDERIPCILEPGESAGLG
jgi:hypothetical protein